MKVDPWPAGFLKPLSPFQIKEVVLERGSLADQAPDAAEYDLWFISATVQRTVDLVHQCLEQQNYSPLHLSERLRARQ